MTRFLVVRHGETSWNVDGLIQGHSESELSDVGIRQAKMAAERLKRENIDAIYSSDLKRAYSTAVELAAHHSLPIVTTPLIREVYFGDWQGLTFEQVSQKYPDEYAAYCRDSVANRAPGGERLEELITRCGEFLITAARKHPDQTVAVSAHGGSVRGLAAFVLGVGPEIYRKMAVENCSLTVIDSDGDRSVLVRLNDVSHITSAGSDGGIDF